jgi:hypothetical protein
VRGMPMSEKVEILIRFVSIPDHGTNAGWLCTPVGYVDGDPLGSGATMREAFDFMIRRIQEPALEARMMQFAKATT